MLYYIMMGIARNLINVLQKAELMQITIVVIKLLVKKLQKRPDLISRK